MKKQNRLKLNQTTRMSFNDMVTAKIAAMAANMKMRIEFQRNGINYLGEVVSVGKRPRLTVKIVEILPDTTPPNDTPVTPQQ
jgi:hypothetical protein